VKAKKSKRPKLHFRLHAVGIAFSAGYIIGSVLYGFLHTYTENGVTWSICGAGTTIIVLMYNWLKKDDEP